MFTLHSPSLKGLSIVRHNLLTRKGYSGYCGGSKCRYGMPRTSWNGTQFKCPCGYVSRIDIAFLTTYVKYWNPDKSYLANRIGATVRKIDNTTLEDVAEYRILKISNNLMTLQKYDFKTKKKIPYLEFTLDIHSMHDYHIVG